jgi:hypothetical protein
MDTMNLAKLLQDHSCYRLTLAEVAKQLFLAKLKDYKPPKYPLSLDVFERTGMAGGVDAGRFDAIRLTFTHQADLNRCYIGMYCYKDGGWVEGIVENEVLDELNHNDVQPAFHTWPYLRGDIVFELFTRDLLEYFTRKSITLFSGPPGGFSTITPSSIIRIDWEGKMD